MVGTYELTGEWFGRFDDVVDYITKEGFDVIDIIAGELICFFDTDERIEYVAKVVNVGRSTYIISKIEEA